MPRRRLPPYAPAILDYLERHPQAQDTLEGIITWWVLEQSIRELAPKVASATAWLVESGYLHAERSADGKIYYRRSTLDPRHPRSRRTASRKVTDP